MEEFAAGGRGVSHGGDGGGRLSGDWEWVREATQSFVVASFVPRLGPVGCSMVAGNETVAPLLMSKKSAAKKPTALVAKNYGGLVVGIGELLETARRASSRAVNAFMTATY